MKIHLILLFCFSFFFSSHVFSLESETHYWYNCGYYTRSIHSLRSELSSSISPEKKSRLYYEIAYSYYAMLFVEDYKKQLDSANFFASKKKNFSIEDKVEYAIGLIRYYNYEVKPKESLAIYKKIYPEFHRLDPQRKSILWIKLYQNIATTRRNAGADYARMNAEYDTAYFLLKKHHFLNTIDEVNYCKSRGNMNLDKVNPTSNKIFYQQALYHFEKATLIIKNQKIINYPLLISFQNLQGLVAYMHGDLEVSRKFFQEAYKTVFQCKIHKFQLIEYESFYLNTCNLGALTINALYKKSKNIQLIIDQLDKLKKTIGFYNTYSHKNRDVDIHVFTDIYGYSPYNAIATCYTYMYENTRNKTYLDSAFYFSEINKTQWLRIKPRMSEFIKETNGYVKKDNVVIQYGEYGYLHKTYLYAIIKNKNGTYFLPLGSDKIIQENLVDVYQWKGYKLHARKSYHLYKEIFKPLEQYIPKETKKVIITKTNFLDAVNFESLVIDTNKSMTTLPFLLRRYPLFVQPSLRIFNNDLEAKKIRTFSMRSSNFENSKVSKIHFMRDTLQSWIAEKNMQKVNCNVSKQDLLIVAAHGFSGSHRVDDAYIDLGNNKLSIRKVCRMNLKVNQTILAICDGGLGQPISAGSTFSFASAFLFAGSSSCVYATWKLDDLVGATMITNYLKRLEEGEQKDWALRNAKLDYLKHVTSEEGYNPIYWAGLQVMGDVSPVEIGNSYIIWFSIVGLMLLVGVGFVIKRVHQLRSV